MHDRRRLIAFALAVLSIVLAMRGAWMNYVILHRVRTSGGDVRETTAWLIVPLVFTLLGTAMTLPRRTGPLWFCVGGLLAFVVLGAWSIGPAFALAGLALLFAGVLHPGRSHARWGSEVVGFLWFLAGLGSTATMFLLRDWAEEGAYLRVHSAPAVVWGAWLFLIASGLLAALYSAEALRLRKQRRT